MKIVYLFVYKTCVSFLKELQEKVYKRQDKTGEKSIS